jgi:hypothetical protein
MTSPNLTVRTARAAVALAVTGAAIASCEQIIGIPDRATHQNVTCVDGQCACEAGFGDCNASLKDGCEIALASDQNNCGACGAVCANGACTAGACACNAGFADCDADATDGCEAELASSPTSCGACGHDCLGGECAASMCGPASVGSITGINSSAGYLGLGDGTLYFAATGAPTAADSSVVSVPTTGGTPTVMAVIPQDDLRALAVTPSYVAVVGEKQLYRIDRKTNVVTKLYSWTALSSYDVQATESDIFLELDDDALLTGQIVRVDPTSGAATVVSNDVDETITDTLVLAGGQPYWVDSNLDVETIVNGVGQVWTHNPKDAFFLVGTDDRLFTFHWSGANGNLTEVRLSDGTSVDWIADPGNLDPITARGDQLIWVNDGGFLRSANATTSTTLASNVMITQRGGLQADDVAVYGATVDDIVRFAR